MALAAFKRIVSSVFDLNRVQENVGDVFRQIGNCPFITGNYVPAQAIGTGATRVAHGLGRVPQGWIVTNKTANSNVWLASLDANYLSLQASANCNIDLWVF